MNSSSSNAELRKLSAEQLTKMGEESLREHIVAQAVVAHIKYAPLDFAKLDILLHDPECLRYPTRLVFEYGEMAMHQFAQPDIDWRNTREEGRVLYIRPQLCDRADLTVMAVAYVVPLVNYGDIVTDEHCLNYGATLLGFTLNEYYSKVCALADFVGAETRLAGQASESACP